MGMPDAPNIQQLSVVIATYNRCEVLKTTLKCLVNQTLPPNAFEVIVVDDGSTDNTARDIPEFISNLPYETSFFTHENRGPGYTENRGIRKAKNRIVLLLADDIWATPELLQEHLSTHKRYPADNIAVLGKVLQSPELPDTVIQRNWDPFLFNRFEDMEMVDPIYFYACNISVKKNFLIENGMFVERKGAAHEDAELGYRLGQKGLEIIYNKRALAYHYHQETLDALVKRAYERGRNFDVLMNTVPGAYLYPVYKIFSFAAPVNYLIKTFPREIVRRAMFNALSVSLFWLPLLRLAEKNGMAALLARPLAYRGVNGYFLRKGYRDMRRTSRHPAETGRQKCRT